MENQTISQVSRTYGVTTRMLRYYEQIGLLDSLRMDDYSYRVYDENALKRLQQIILLRKLQISVKKIGVILNNPEAAAVIDIFKKNISELEKEISALSTIKSILKSFVVEIEKITDIHLNLDLLNNDSVQKLAESLSLIQRNVKENFSMEKINKADQQLSQLQDVRIIYLPPMTVAASYATGKNCEGKASDTLNKFVNQSGLLKMKPDTRHFGFDRSGSNPPPGLSGINELSYGYEMWVSIPGDMEVPAPLVKRVFHGGLYAAHMIKIGGWGDWSLLKRWVMENGKYIHDWGIARWTPFEEGMEHCLEEQLNFLNNIQNTDFDHNEMQLDLLFPIKPA